MASKMRRKFGISVAPLKLPSRSQDRALRETLDPDQPSPPPQAFSVRYPPLSPKTEYQLRQACAALGRDSKPSSQGLNAPSQRPARAKDGKSHARTASDPQHSDSTGGLSDIGALEPSKFSYKPDADLKDLLGEPLGNAQTVPANISRRREAVGISTEGPRPKERQKSFTSSGRPDFLVKPSDARSKSSTRADLYDTATSTPHTGSSDIPWASSTAPTSEAITPARSSKRGSNQHVLNEQEIASRADEAATEWSRIEKDKGKVQDSAKDRQEEVPAPGTAPYNPIAPERPPSRARSTSRARSIKDAVQNYIRPGAPPSSRSASRESFRSLKSDCRTSPSGFRWRSWSLTRNRSARQESRPGSRDGKSSDHDENSRGRSTTKPEINLNRELPPLPSLDTWQEPEPEPAMQSRHVANLIRSGADSQPTRSRFTAEPSSRSTPHSPIEVPRTEAQPSSRRGHSKNNSFHIQTPVPLHPPRTSSRQANNESTRHAPASVHMQSYPASLPLATPRTKSPVPLSPDPSTATSRSRTQSIVSRLRSASQSSIKPPSIPSASTRSDTCLQERASNELNTTGTESEQSIDMNRAASSNQPWQSEAVYTLTQTKTVGLTRGLAVPIHQPAGNDTSASSNGGNGKTTGLRARSTSAANPVISASGSSARDVYTNDNAPYAHPTQRQISSDLRRNGSVAPWEYPTKGPPPLSHPDPHRRPRKVTDIVPSGNETTRLRSKFSRFFSSTNHQGGMSSAKQKSTRKDTVGWVDMPEVLHGHARQRSRDVMVADERAAAAPTIRY
ncbi:MAG: hypothetical protein M1822_007524 [Bathelium mastoideum]|nr:MAG: hypothetical protein M1822_007524 [Bathelium mastoideum]